MSLFFFLIASASFGCFYYWRLGNVLFAIPLGLWAIATLCMCLVSQRGARIKSSPKPSYFLLAALVSTTISLTLWALLQHNLTLLIWACILAFTSIGSLLPHITHAHINRPLPDWLVKGVTTTLGVAFLAAAALCAPIILMIIASTLFALLPIIVLLSIIFIALALLSRQP